MSAPIESRILHTIAEMPLSSSPYALRSQMQPTFPRVGGRSVLDFLELALDSPPPDLCER